MHKYFFLFESVIKTILQIERICYAYVHVHIYASYLVMLIMASYFVDDVDDDHDDVTLIMSVHYSLQSQTSNNDRTIKNKTKILLKSKHIKTETHKK